jgi:two-component system, NarL family, response regulator LiaR
MAAQFFRRNKQIVLYGMALAVLLFLLKWLEWRFLLFDHAIELYSGAIALLFTGLGIWLALKLAKPKVSTVVIEKKVPVPAARGEDKAVIAAELAKLGLSQRELEVLRLMAEGLSNQEIADRLFVSLNTIKTHCSRIFEKLDARRRTQAIEKAKRLRIIG